MVVVSGREGMRWIRRDSSFLPVITIISRSSIRVCGGLGREIPPLSVFLLQPVQELGKLHLTGNRMSGRVKRYHTD